MGTRTLFGCLVVVTIVVGFTGCGGQSTPLAVPLAAYKVGSLPTKWGANPKIKYLTNWGDLTGKIIDEREYHFNPVQATWFFESSGKLDHFYLKNAGTGKCLTAAGLIDNSAVTQSHCQSGSKEQIWKLENLGSQWGYHLRSTASDKCLETTGFNDEDKVRLWECSPPSVAMNQLWFIEAEPEAPNPPHDSGQGGLCDFCNPDGPDPGCKEPGAKCITTVVGQSYCGRACSSNSPCPQGYQCITKKQQVGSTNQCVPDNKKMECSYESIEP